MSLLSPSPLYEWKGFFALYWRKLFKEVIVQGGAGVTPFIPPSLFATQILGEFFIKDFKRRGVIPYLPHTLLNCCTYFTSIFTWGTLSRYNKTLCTTVSSWNSSFWQTKYNWLAVSIVRPKILIWLKNVLPCFMFRMN